MNAMKALLALFFLGGIGPARPAWSDTVCRAVDPTPKNRKNLILYIKHRAPRADNNFNRHDAIEELKKAEIITDNQASVLLAVYVNAKKGNDFDENKYFRHALEHPEMSGNHAKLLRALAAIAKKDNDLNEKRLFDEVLKFPKLSNVKTAALLRIIAHASRHNDVDDTKVFLGLLKADV